MFLGISAAAWSYIFIGVLILAGTITQGTIGFGLGTIATPIIALIRPELVPTLILLLALCISSYTLARTYHETSWRVVGISSLARIPGSLVGAWAIASLSPNGLSIFIGCAVLFAMTLSSLGWSPRPTTLNTLIAGVASGILGTSTSIGGPPMALIMKRFDPDRTRGTLAGTFVLGTLVSLIILAFSGQISSTQMGAAAAYLPLVIVGLIAANHLNQFIDRNLLNRIVLIVAISAALMLIVESAVF
ncbi:sulfite exporter TauE/SafE family protein [Corynebacterium tuberculostearicum]|uniref:sulfite exporter TauE/SafE family protein n=1 Tax=Corynebacterium tuberculostearicum TaxID=38304 RepID=UPI00264882A1|nr:sulfite exporter TauE/SafE family protein [Corynebacterium tuberculostearicum]WKE56424.1 sulfite exporter TauE/SafE family protein [Corynebacterium tuberculostearicum]WKE59990.1 sulfite exporter TauE/SafE family protein [Corynebacterium tuberculostearicum]